MKRDICILYVVILLLFISVGYAMVNEEMVVNASSYGIEYNNFIVSEGSVSTDIPSISNNKVNYNVSLNVPGDYYEFNFDVVNNSNYDMVLDDYNIDGLSESQKKYLEYIVKYNDGDSIKTGDIIKSNSKVTLKVRMYFKEDITVDDLPLYEESLELPLMLNYVQKI